MVDILWGGNGSKHRYIEIKTTEFSDNKIHLYVYKSYMKVTYPENACYYIQIGLNKKYEPTYSSLDIPRYAYGIQVDQKTLQLYEKYVMEILLPQLDIKQFRIDFYKKEIKNREEIIAGINKTIKSFEEEILKIEQI